MERWLESHFSWDGQASLLQAWNMNCRITTSQHAGLVHTYPDIFENWDFFLRFSLVSARQRRFWAPETQIFQNGPQRGIFFKTTADRFRADGRKRKLSNLTMMSYIIERMPCKGYHNVVLAFSCGQTEAIRIWYVWTRPYTVVNFFAALISWLFQDDPLSQFLCRISRIFSIAKLGIVVIVTFMLW